MGLAAAAVVDDDDFFFSKQCLLPNRTIIFYLQLPDQTSWGPGSLGLLTFQTLVSLLYTSYLYNTCEVYTSYHFSHQEFVFFQGGGEVETLSPEALIKHPLQCRWSLWFFKNDKTKEWSANLKQVTVVDTVEDFWA